MIVHRMATQEDILAWFGRVPASMRAMILVADEEMIAIGGVAHFKDGARAFMEWNDKIKKYPIATMKASLALMDRLRKDGYTSVMACLHDAVVAPRFLERLGFKPVTERVYRWDS